MKKFLCNNQNDEIENRILEEIPAFFLPFGALENRTNFKFAPISRAIIPIAKYHI